MPVAIGVGRQEATALHDEHARVADLPGARLVGFCPEAALEHGFVALAVGEARAGGLDEADAAARLRAVLGFLSTHVRHDDCLMVVDRSTKLIQICILRTLHAVLLRNAMCCVTRNP